MKPLVIVAEKSWKPQLSNKGKYTIIDDLSSHTSCKTEFAVFNDAKFLNTEVFQFFEGFPEIICVRFYRGPKDKATEKLWEELTQDNSLFSMMTAEEPCNKKCFIINGSNISDEDFFVEVEKVVSGNIKKFQPDYSKKYDPATFTWGSELEWGDIPRQVHPPEKLGSWENSETEVLNLREPYAYVAADPIGENPPVGGEINVRPTKTWQKQVENILSIKKFYEEKGHPPTVSCMQGMHIHVHIPGLIDDVQGLKNFTWFVKQNQRQLIDLLHGYKKDPRMVGKAASILNTCATPMPDWKCDNLFKSRDFEDFILIQCCGKDGVSRARPIRYAVNTYNLKHIRTIEYRVPRATLDSSQIEDVFEFLFEYTSAALNGGVSFQDILAKKSWNIATFKYVPEEFEGWYETKHPKERGIKTRSFISPEEL